MRGDRLLIRQTGVSWREVNGEVIALDLESSSYFTTNRTGSLMWTTLVHGATRGELIELLRSTYGVSPEVAQSDVDDFLDVLDAHRLLADPS